MCIRDRADGYNSMADHINRLIHDVFQTEIRSQQEHLTMLQSQIRPHFLYNSLSSIVRLCDRGDVGLIREMAQALVRFYRISLSKGRETITLQEEIDHVSAYVQVCAIRYRGKFQMRYEISPEAKSCFVPKIILQPFVENALEHGMHPTLGILHIEISARVEEGMLLVEIQDDGVGMDENRLREMEKDVYKRQGAVRVLGDGADGKGVVQVRGLQHGEVAVVGAVVEFRLPFRVGSVGPVSYTHLQIPIYRTTIGYPLFCPKSILTNGTLLNGRIGLAIKKQKHAEKRKNGIAMKDDTGFS